jgi:N6-adenosine-specific RNA methylase IME4
LSGKYQIIYADPPWRYDDKLDSGRRLKYPTMDESAIASLPIPSLAAADCALFMWATWPKLREALYVMSAWEFELKTCAFVWVKTQRRNAFRSLSFWDRDELTLSNLFVGMGRWTRSNSEFVLLGVKGSPRRASADVRQIIVAPIGRHSAKPAETRERIVRLMGDLPRVELFAREKAEGWAAWGNEVSSDVEMVA